MSELRVAIPELLLAGQPLPVSVTVLDDARVALRIAVFNESGQLVNARVARPINGTVTTTIESLAPGAYSIELTGLDRASAVAPISSDVLIWA